MSVKKIAVVGAGHVGATCSQLLAQKELAREVILIDYQTWTVLEQKEADTSMPPSSMSKLMTAYMLFDAVHSGAISLDDEFEVSENAWRKGVGTAERCSKNG